MGIKKPNYSDTIKLVLRVDSAIPEDMTDEIYQTYLETLDEEILNLTEEPTRFVMRKQLPFTAQKNITNEQMGVDMEGKAQMKLGFMLEEVRASLIDIENPPSYTEEQKIVFKRDSDGLASKELIGMLNTMKLIMPIYGARQTILEKNEAQQKKM